MVDKYYRLTDHVHGSLDDIGRPPSRKSVQCSNCKKWLSYQETERNQTMCNDCGGGKCGGCGGCK
jgi:hypothetical protein